MDQRVGAADFPLPNTSEDESDNFSIATIANNIFIGLSSKLASDRYAMLPVRADPDDIDKSMK